MSREKKFQVIDIVLFVLIILITIMAFCNKRFSMMVDSFFLPEERNKAYYDMLNSPSKCFECKELSQNGTKNLLANYLRSGDREAGYSITVNQDGTFLISGNYTGEYDASEAITPSGVDLNLPSGDYVLSDGGASSEDSVYIKLTGIKLLIGGGTEYVTIASLPGDGSFHWDRDPNVELYCEIVIRPRASLDNVEFRPMLLKVEDNANQDYQPCLTPNYDWKKDETDGGVKFYKYDINKGALDGEIVTKDDWKIMVNSMRFQMQADKAVIDLKDGHGIEIRKCEYPMGTYGKLNVSMTVRDGKEINIEDYNEVMKVINSNSEEIELSDVRDIYSYLKALGNGKYTILVSVSDDGVAALNREAMELLRKLGVKTNLAEQNIENVVNRAYYRNSFYCVLRHGKNVAEKIGEENLSLSGVLPDDAEYTIESSGQNTGGVNSSIRIDGNEYAMNFRGMNFVIYDEEQHFVVDSVCFDTNSGLYCHRQAEHM
ncbi:hypothetical protein [Oribacterium sp. WCC10]|uniref:hypothetical protein n=1 Tax=Oribacterium sp. WCC10 TaxID=1855343 RepID=UPI0008E811DC|nr:hypothetical protein [Oribacterium sp. WCC10]SFG36731.1 hypothetical protein SAMN05216356_106183 [Oribacterium sp. WCC10]